MGVRRVVDAAEVVDLGNVSDSKLGHKTVSIEGNFVGTLQFQGSTPDTDAAQRSPILATPFDSETPATDLVFAGAGDQNGKYVVAVPAGVRVHIEATVYTSGSAVITTEDGIS